MFLRNAWYVAAWSHEVAERPARSLVLGENLCLYRGDDGRIAALADGCPHRGLPLSMGRIVGDDVECGYHGLTFDRAGGCVSAPSGHVPRGASVRAYPVEERYELIWVWMGPPELADPALIFEVEHYGDPAWGINRGPAIDYACSYLYITDNLLDPSHVAWVHRSSFGEDSARDTPLDVEVADTGVTVSRWMLSCEPAPFYRKVIEFTGRCDRLQQYEVRYPSHALIKAVFAPAGTGAPEGVANDQTFVMDSYNFMTPMTESSTRYYWFQMRNVRPDDDELSTMMSEGVLQRLRRGSGRARRGTGRNGREDPPRR